MPRTARVILAGLPHHITQRGNRREDVFFCDADRSTYLDWLRDYCDQNHVQILAYCLMSNHVHIVAIPAAGNAFELTFRPLHTRFAMRVNRRRGSSGHVWQGRYFASALDESYLWAAIRYVERNPVRAAMVTKAEQYRWSSAAAHCGLGDDAVLTGHRAWLGELESVPDWSGWLAEGDRPSQLTVLRQQAWRGLPCGSDAFVRDVETRLGRLITPRLPGRPKKEGQAR